LLSASSVPALTSRALTSHKGDFGRVLLVGGSRGMSGAVALAGMAALRSGAGLVTLAVPDVCLDVIACMAPEYMTVPLPTDTEGRITGAAVERIRDLAQTATVVGMGPGLGRSQQLDRLVPAIVSNVDLPMVVDADGLNALASAQPPIDLGLRQRATPVILTPHPGEFRRLTTQPENSLAQLRACAPAFAQQHNAIVLLKGHRTLITDGTQSVENTTGNPGMATGGAGDVLTGIIAALLGQGLAPFDAAQLGAHVHGVAGDLAADKLGQTSLIAGDLVDHLPAAFLSLSPANE